MVEQEPRESLVDALVRLGIKPPPSFEQMQRMTDDERQAARAASFVTSEQYELLPIWFREKMRRQAEETIARRDAE